MSFQFGIVTMTNVPLHLQRARWRTLEELGFDQVFVGDLSHMYGIVEVDGKRRFAATPETYFEAWTMLVDMALHTQRVRIGTLVSSPVLRGPALLAMEAAAVDQLSGGRLELGIGLGVAYDHAAMGVDHWPWQERADRYREYVALVDQLLRCREGHVEFQGHYHRTSQPALNPGSRQRPRPPIHSCGQSGTAVRIAAELADVWHGPARMNDSVDEAFERLRRLSRQLDRGCEERQRDPATVRRAVDLMATLDPWHRPDAFEEYVTRFAELGFREFVVAWPPESAVPLLERIGTHVIPSLRS
jgi:alkanesulfonate monooxygenase SsuD/methylene tetrahydromethanopterin reductase-like flavin-dependent oxidoreductase (luciferase family)